MEPEADDLVSVSGSVEEVYYERRRKTGGVLCG